MCSLLFFSSSLLLFSSSPLLLFSSSSLLLLFSSSSPLLLFSSSPLLLFSFSQVLRLSSMGLSCHVSELLHFVKACYPDLVELDANPPLDTWDDFGNTLVRNRWLHGDLPSPLLLPKKLKRLSFHRTSITGQLPPGSDIAQLDYFNVDNTTIDGPIPKDW